MAGLFSTHVREMKRGVQFLILIAIIIAITAFFFLQPSAVTVTGPVRGNAVQAVYATGTVEPTVMLPIAPRVTARLAELLVDEGTTVAKNQLLARLEDEDVKSALAELQARADYAEREYHRQEKLLARKVSTVQARDKARTEWDAAQAAVKRAMAEANYLQLESPADGRIIRRDGEVGELIPANTAIFWMSCCAPLRISAEVDEEDIPLVKPGQKVLIRADAFPGKTFDGFVQAITPKGDATARSYRVRIGLEDETPLMIGMTAEANIIAGEHENALLVPTSSVEGDAVWVVEDEKLIRRKVDIGARGQKQTEILSGLAEDAQVAIHPGDAPEEGMSVRVKRIAED